MSLAHEIVRAKALDRVHLGLDFFDASINRIGAYVIGARSTLKALMIALLEPWDMLREVEASGNYFKRLALLEEIKTMPYGAVWDYYCQQKGVSIGNSWIEEVLTYENDVLRKRI
jgi:L-rhamnose isomerase